MRDSCLYGFLSLSRLVLSSDCNKRPLFKASDHSSERLC